MQASPPLEQVTTSSYEALKAYTDGAHAFDVEHDFPKAIPLLRRAVSIDTGFATAWRKLGTALNNSFYPQSVADSAVTKAYQLRGRLSEKERYLAEGYYFNTGPGHDRQRAIAAYLALIDLGDTNYAANNVGVVYTTMRDFAKAESYYRMSMRSNPDNNIPLPNLINVLIDQGKKAALDSAMAEEGKRIPNSGPHAYHTIVIPYADGEYDRAEKLADSIHGASAALNVRTMSSRVSSGILAMRGRLAESERRYRQWIGERAELGNPNPPIADSIAFASYDAWLRNQGKRAVARLDVSVAAHPLSALPEKDRPYTELARAYAMAGRPDKARAALAQFAQIKDSSFLRSRQPDLHEALGEIALAEKRYPDAIVEFRSADRASDGKPAYDNPVHGHFNLGRAYDLASQPDSAIAEFEANIATRYEVGSTTTNSRSRGRTSGSASCTTRRAIARKRSRTCRSSSSSGKTPTRSLQPAVADAKRRLTKLQAGGKRYRTPHSSPGLGFVVALACPARWRDETPRPALVRMRQREQPRVASGKSDERDVARRHAVGAQARRHGDFRQPEPVAVAERGANVRPRVDGARCGERHRRIDHRVERCARNVSASCRDQVCTRSRERYAGRIVARMAAR